jgi:UDP-glucose 4-epimerase
MTPISPYGYHKRIVEELLESYSRSFGIRVGIIRFVSIYGPGLTKQLLWDASAKLRAAAGGSATFWGTGEETRDWISSDDAAELVLAVARSDRDILVVNGASGQRTTVQQVLEMLKRALDANTDVRFNGTVREGDPRFYHADIAEALALGWKPALPLTEGIEQYARWYVAHEEASLD